jgi:beta-glucosidase
MNDGPEGFRGAPGTSTQWPSGLSVAHSWDPALFGAWGAAMGAEFSGKGANVQFGPGANLARIPSAGRSFEYLAGEDPFLGYTLIQPMVKGVQSQGVVANAKHFVDNNQEGEGDKSGDVGSRHSTSEMVDERTQMEMYFPTFEGAVKAGVLSIMCGNQLVNGVYVCENNVTSTMLRNAGFKGWMCSDCA